MPGMSESMTQAGGWFSEMFSSFLDGDQLEAPERKPLKALFFAIVLPGLVLAVGTQLSGGSFSQLTSGGAMLPVALICGGSILIAVDALVLTNKKNAERMRKTRQAVFFGVIVPGVLFAVAMMIARSTDLTHMTKWGTMTAVGMIPVVMLLSLSVNVAIQALCGRNKKLLRKVRQIMTIAIPVIFSLLAAAVIAQLVKGLTTSPNLQVSPSGIEGPATSVDQILEWMVPSFVLLAAGAALVGRFSKQVKDVFPDRQFKMDQKEYLAYVRKQRALKARERQALDRRLNERQAELVAASRG